MIYLCDAKEVQVCGSISCIRSIGGVEKKERLFNDRLKDVSNGRIYKMV
jgi:hypothetical protein